MLGVSEQRVRQLVTAGKLAGRKIGRTWIVSKQGVEKRMKG